ncbi:SOS response-associated peptidase [Beijerinckia sp. L45]|uniref:SOS response-associated peptidase n=1 Tax=Beijerinckia sp. L45 TaxID=1641855 RepID=UPI00131CF767|nr:SOS response-associated peptidase [Beijerinckia sp. L45]
MCGRYAITLPPEAMRQLFAYAEQPNFPPRYNIAPTQPIPIVRAVRQNGVASRHFSLARWAFLPGFVKDPKTFALIFNARSEGLGEKPSFRNALRRRRCLMPADCFYEWQRFGSGKGAVSQPFLFKRADGAPLALAGLWETWAGPNGEEVDTACIITTDANGATSAIHPRLPAIIEPAEFDLWLETDETYADEAAALLRPPGNDVLTFFAIGDAVNKVANDGPAVQLPLAAQPVVPRREPEPPLQPSLF